MKIYLVGVLLALGLLVGDIYALAGNKPFNPSGAVGFFDSNSSVFVIKGWAFECSSQIPVLVALDINGSRVEKFQAARNVRNDYQFGSPPQDCSLNSGFIFTPNLWNYKGRSVRISISIVDQLSNGLDAPAEKKLWETTAYVPNGPANPVSPGNSNNLDPSIAPLLGPHGPSHCARATLDEKVIQALPSSECSFVLNPNRVTFFDRPRWYSDITKSQDYFSLPIGASVSNLKTDITLNSLRMNDRISSIWIPNGVVVTVCEHAEFSGKCVELRPKDFYEMWKLENVGFNDSISSIRVNREVP